MDLQSLPFINLTAAVVHGGDLHSRVFILLPTRPGGENVLSFMNATSQRGKEEREQEWNRNSVFFNVLM